MDTRLHGTTSPMSVCEDEAMVCSEVLTGKGSAPSWMTKPSIRCVSTWGLTTACGGGALSPCTPRDIDRAGGEGEAVPEAGR